MDKFVSSLKSNKGQIFLFDLIFSSVIIVVTVGIFLSYYGSSNQNIDIYEINVGIMEGYTKTELEFLNNIEIREMFENYEITNKEFTVAQQTAEYIRRGDMVLAEKITSGFVEDYINRQFNFQLLLRNETNEYELYYVENNDVDFQDSEITAISKRTVISFVNSTESFSTYEFEVRIWQ